MVKNNDEKTQTLKQEIPSLIAVLPHLVDFRANSSIYHQAYQYTYIIYYQAY